MLSEIYLNITYSLLFYEFKSIINLFIINFKFKQPYSLLSYLNFFFFPSVDCLYSPTSHLSHKFETCVIAPGKTLKVPFTFCPTQAIKYHETVVFEINGLNKQKVEFYGTGHEMKVWSPIFNTLVK